MPLRIAKEPAEPHTPVDTTGQQFLIFYSSIVDGQSWCPDCRNVEDLVQQTFGSDDSPSALIVYVGNKPEWKSTSNPFRDEPWKLTDIPTIIRLRDGDRIVEKDIPVPDALSVFVRG